MYLLLGISVKKKERIRLKFKYFLMNMRQIYIKKLYFTQTIYIVDAETKSRIY